MGYGNTYAKNGNKFRAQQLSTLAKIAYDLSTNDEYGNLLNKLSQDESLSFDEKETFLSNKEYLKKKYSIDLLKDNHY